MLLLAYEVIRVGYCPGDNRARLVPDAEQRVADGLPVVDPSRAGCVALACRAHRSIAHLARVRGIIPESPIGSRLDPALIRELPLSKL